jgi:hypothetical protein
MNNPTVKQKLVDYMIANGNKFTYTEMIKALLKLQSGGRHEYNWRRDRGYFATNFGEYGYMSNGSGDCGVFKGEDGKWSAKYYTEQEKLQYKMDKLFNMFYSVTYRTGYNAHYHNYDRLIAQINYNSIKTEFARSFKKSFTLK